MNWDHLPDSHKRDLLTALENYLDENYRFRKEKRYKGFFGFFRAACDTQKAEDIEAQRNGERYDREQVFFSSPYAFAHLHAEYLERQKKIAFLFI